MKINYMQCWNGAMAILRAHKEAILAIAGVFLFLPTLLMAQFVGQPVLDGSEDMSAIIANYTSFTQENLWPILLSNILMSFGGFALYVVICASPGATVGESLGIAFRFFLFFLIANILAGLATGIGLMLLIIPGLYVASRLSLIPVIVADRQERNPVEALKQSWAATKDNGFAILLLILMIALIGSIFLAVVQMLTGVAVGLATGGQGWPLITNIVATLLNTALAVILTAIIASIYRELTGKQTDVGEVFS